ncbi:hypothetical protein KG089_00580 [Carnobacteriaceae bacterium zg-ZUI252]|nr:hypothetical protein [Carnobacteriaceae bacterium zg-ZUI252]
METLVMPMNYVELQEDEMMYLDGGWNAGQIVKNIVGFAAITGIGWVANYVKQIVATNPGIGFWEMTSKIGGSLVSGFWALPWWAKIAAIGTGAAVVYALGEWDLF